MFKTTQHLRSTALKVHVATKRKRKTDLRSDFQPEAEHYYEFVGLCPVVNKKQEQRQEIIHEKIKILVS